MFNFDTMVDDGLASFKSFADHVPHVETRRELVKLAEAQAAYTKSLLAFGANVTKTFGEQIKAAK